MLIFLKNYKHCKINALRLFLITGLSCVLFFTTAYDIGNHVGQRNWFHQTNYQNANRRSRQVFAFPDGDSQGFRRQNVRNNRQEFGNNQRGFTWGSNNNNNRRRLPTQNDIRPISEDLNDVFVFDQNDDRPSSFSGSTRRPQQPFASTQRTPTRRPQQSFSSTQRTPTSTVAIPGMGTTRSACEDACLTTPEYNPVCGDDGFTYFSKARLRCAQKCGKS